MSFPKRLRLTAQSSIKCQYVRFENELPSSNGISIDIIGNDLRMMRFPVRESAEKPTTNPQKCDQDEFICIA